MDFSRLLGLRIRQAALFGQLAESELKELEKTASIKRFETNNILAADGSSPANMMMILSGSVNIRKNNPDAKETVMRRLGPPTVFGYCLLSGQHYTADIVAADTVISALFPLEQTKGILIRYPETLLTVIGHLSTLVESLSQERIELKNIPLKQRIQRVLKEICDSNGICHVSHEELGLMAGGSRANVSRALKELEQAGRLVLGRRKIQVVNS